MKTKNNFFYGWIVVICACIVMSTVYGIIFNTPGLFVKYISNDLGVSRSLISVQMALMTMTFAVISFFIGKKIDNIGIKNSMILGTVFASFGLIGFSFVESLPLFYICSVMTGIGMGFATSVPVNVLISKWFEEKSGLITGIVLSFTGVGGFLATQLINFLINTRSWRSAYMAVGLICLFVTLPIIIIFIKESPSSIGQLPYGESKNKNLKLDISGYTLKEIKNNKHFKSLLLGVFILNFINTGLLSHLPSFITDIGHSSNFAATINSIFLVGLMASKFLMGNLLDKIGGKKVFFIGSICFVIVFTLCTIGTSKLICIVFSIIFSIGSSLGTVSLPFLARDLYGKKDYASILGIITFVGMMGCSIASPFSGFINDTFNSYNIAWVIYGCLGATVYLFIKYAYKLRYNPEVIEK